MKYSLALVSVLLTACGACAGLQHPGRSPQAMHQATVKIETTCGEGVNARVGWGSGVLVSDDTVLTANHVIQCALVPGVPIYLAPSKVTVDAGDGVKHDADVELAFGDDTKDVARIKLRDTKKNSLHGFMSPIRIGPRPGIGDTVCESSAVPRWTYRCGTVQPTDGYIRFEGMIEHGNSGSGLYNANGELVGIVVQLWTCEDGSFCGGRGAPLQDWPWLVP